jgi:hypothetical protein
MDKTHRVPAVTTANANGTMQATESVIDRHLGISTKMDAAIGLKFTKTTTCSAINLS